MRRHKPPTLVSMWMLDVFCCALGCVTLLWLLKAREAGIASDETAQTTTLLTQTRDRLLDTESESARRLAQAEKLTSDLDSLKVQLTTLRLERDDLEKKRLALDEELQQNQKDLVDARNKVQDLKKLMAGLNSKLTASDAEMAKKRGELEAILKQLELARKKQSELDILVREKEKARSDFESKLAASEKKLDEVTRSVADGAKMKSRVDQLERLLKDQRTQLDEANVTIVDLQGTKAKLADKVNQLQIETDNKFAGITMTGKNVVFMVDMSGSMDRLEESQLAPSKWPTVRDTLCKVMRSLPDLEKFQVILFSRKANYLLEGDDWITYEKEKSINRVHAAMTAMKPVGDTNLYLAFEEAFKYRSKGLDTIYLFSDGLPTSGPGLTELQEKTLTNETERSTLLARHLRRTINNTWNTLDTKASRVRINSIGFFYESPDVGAFLWSLSRENDGSFVGMSRP